MVLTGSYSSKGLKIMNLGGVQTADGVAAVLQTEDDDAVDPHLERIKNEAGGDESDEEVLFIVFSPYDCSPLLIFTLIL